MYVFDICRSGGSRYRTGGDDPWNMRWDSATPATRPDYLYPVSAVSILTIISHTLGPAYDEFG